MQQNFVRIQKSVHSEGRVRDGLIRVLVMHRGCRDGREGREGKEGKGCCGHLGKFVSKLEMLCWQSMNRPVETSQQNTSTA